MEILSYSPSIEVYAMVGKGDYYDLTGDVVSATVSRVQDGASSFTVRLQNVGGKYNGVFTPMDKLKIYATKIERVPLITGYVTTVPKYTLYGEDISLSGSCSLCRFQKLFWDPGLIASQKLLGTSGWETNWDSVLVNLLTKVGGMPRECISIGEMPADIVDWARSMYEAQQNDIAQMSSMMDEFYEILQTHGPQVASGYGVAAGGGFSLLGDGIDFSIPESKFVAIWGPRIDAFIARVIGTHSPVYGHGNVYARAAYKGKMDPRWLPTIGFFETGLGTAPSYAGYPYNLYGWGCTDSGETSVARSQNGYDAFIEFILCNAGGRGNGWGGAKVLNEYTDLAELDATYCSGSAGRIAKLKEYMGTI